MMVLVVFEWDRRKAEINLKKHTVDFADAVAVFSDDSAITLQDGSTRLISARRATRRERRQYEERR